MSNSDDFDTIEAEIKATREQIDSLEKKLRDLRVKRGKCISGIKEYYTLQLKSDERTLLIGAWTNEETAKYFLPLNNKYTHKLIAFPNTVRKSIFNSKETFECSVVKVLVHEKDTILLSTINHFTTSRKLTDYIIQDIAETSELGIQINYQ
jgi:hypothetical protein